MNKSGLERKNAQARFVLAGGTETELQKKEPFLNDSFFIKGQKRM